MQKVRISYSRLIFSVLATIFIIYIIVTIITSQIDINAGKHTVNEYTNKLQQEADIAKNLNELEQKQGTDENIEKLAREKLGLYKNNERIFIDGSLR